MSRWVRGRDRAGGEGDREGTEIEKRKGRSNREGERVEGEIESEKEGCAVGKRVQRWRERE